MAKKAIKPMTWTVKYFDWNAQVIKDYDVLKYLEKDIKHFKKICDGSKAAFAEALKRELSWRYWSKCEWELIIEIDANKRVWLRPWIGRMNSEKARIDVTNDITFDWLAFAELHCSRQRFKNTAKVDVYDQLMFRWQDFVDYCWNYRHKWQRTKNKLGEQYDTSNE